MRAYFQSYEVARRFALYKETANARYFHHMRKIEGGWRVEW